jgi:hypothetical protein
MVSMDEGNAAHTVISGLYELEHLSDSTLYDMKAWVGSPTGRADITNLSRATAAEIKTFPEEAAGQLQLRGYLALLNSAGRAGKTTWGPDPWYPVFPFFWLGAVNSRFRDVFGMVLYNKTGVLVYELWNRNEPAPVPVEL